VTCDDFVQAMSDANGVDLTPYLAWYGQSGTPRLKAHGRHDAARREYTLTLTQHPPGIAGSEARRPLPIPVKLALFARNGEMLPLHLDGQTSISQREMVVVLEQAEQSFVFSEVDGVPVASLLRGFSAPVILECDYTPDELALLLTHDADGFNRWEAGQQLAARAYENLRDGDTDEALRAWCEALTRLFGGDAVDDALLADLLTPPGEIELAERETAIDPQRIHDLRQDLQRRLAERLGADTLRQRYRALAAHTSIQLDASSQARRRLKRRVLELLNLVDHRGACELAAAQYRDAPGMTDRLAALAVLVRGHAAQAAALLDYRQRYAGNALALDKWFAVQAQLPGERALERVLTLEADPAFTLKNPNRVQALLGAFVRGNPSGFHRADGAGYRLLAERLIALDALNPQVAARLATAFNGWQRLEPLRREVAREAIAELGRHAGLSRNLAEIVGSVLGH
jgi:aminopeptidase N